MYTIVIVGILLVMIIIICILCPPDICILVLTQEYLRMWPDLEITSMQM